MFQYIIDTILLHYPAPAFFLYATGPFRHLSGTALDAFARTPLPDALFSLLEVVAIADASV